MCLYMPGGSRHGHQDPWVVFRTVISCHGVLSSRPRRDERLWWWWLAAATSGLDKKAKN